MQTSGVEFKVKFALHVIGKILASRSDILVKRTFIPFLHEVELIEHMNWAKFVLDELVIGIRNAQMMKDEQVNGCVVFLMVRSHLNCNCKISFGLCLTCYINAAILHGALLHSWRCIYPFAYPCKTLGTILGH